MDIVGTGDVRSEVLLSECGGELEVSLKECIELLEFGETELIESQLPYDHDTYWPTMMKLCKDRRVDHLKRWRALGEAAVGREERLFKVAVDA